MSEVIEREIARLETLRAALIDAGLKNLALELEDIVSELDELIYFEDEDNDI